MFLYLKSSLELCLFSSTLDLVIELSLCSSNVLRGENWSIFTAWDGNIPTPSALNKQGKIKILTDEKQN